MRNKKYNSVAVGIGIFVVFAILIAWIAGPAGNPEPTQDEGARQKAAADTSYGTVLLPEAISRLEADGTGGYVTLKPGGKTEQMPAGRYHVRFWKIERKDDAGNTWALAGHYFGQDNPFEVKADDQTRLDVGEPIVATVEARNVGPSYAFNQVIKGRRDEVVELTRNGSRPQPPKLHIKNKDGSYSETFDFQYG